MQIQAKLCHTEPNRCIVRVSGWLGGEPLGSALGEGPTAESAEDRALERLITRLSNKKLHSDGVDLDEIEHTQSIAIDNKKLKKKENQQVDEHSPSEAIKKMSTLKHLHDTQKDPEDWSDELAAIDHELQRIGWEREEEMFYLERCFGYASRHRITRYSDLTSFLNQLKEIKPGEGPNQSGKPSPRADLLNQCDKVLEKLKWNPEQARSYLQEQLKVRSRQQLNDQELLKFIMLLEAELKTVKQS